jgi:hypothetical protein
MRFMSIYSARFLEAVGGDGVSEVRQMAMLEEGKC